MNICEHLTATSRLVPDKEALVFAGHRFTYAQLNEMSAIAAARLEADGISRGDRVALMLPNTPSFVVWYFAALRLGAIAVSISTRLTPQEVEFVIGDCDAKAFVGELSNTSVLDSLPNCVTASFAVSDLADEFDSASLEAESSTDVAHWVDTGPDEAALILYTSGTTGFAKGATLSHMNVRSNVHAFNHLCNMRPDDRILLAVPLFHCFGQNALLNSALNVGATIVLQRKFDPLESRQLIREQRVTQLYGVPTMFQLLQECCQPEDLESVGYCFSAAAKLPVQVGQRWRQKFEMPIHEGYGLTETSPFASYNHRDHFVPGSIGTPIDCVEMKIVDTDSGEEQGPGQLGEIVIRGPNVMLGYWNRSDDTARAIRDGWFYSGDIGRVDEKGFFYIVDRVKDMIAVGGLKVFPAEVERVLLDHAAISEVAVVGMPDHVFGEQVVAFIVAASDVHRDESTLADIVEYARANLANYKMPRRYLFVNELPRNPSGKVLKRELRETDLATEEAARAGKVGGKVAGKAGELGEGRHALDSLPAGLRTIQPTLRRKLMETHASERVRVASEFVQHLVESVGALDKTPPVDSQFLKLGLDSLMVVEVSHRIQVELGADVAVPSTLVFDHPRICDLGAWLADTICPRDLKNQNSAEAREAALSTDDDSALRDSIEAMSEQEALDELMKELEQ